MYVYYNTSSHLKIMRTFSWTGGGGLVHNLVSIIPHYNLDDLQKFEDNLDYSGL